MTSDRLRRAAVGTEDQVRAPQARALLTEDRDVEAERVLREMLARRYPPPLARPAR